jgi:hypothetical protein
MTDDTLPDPRSEFHHTYTRQEWYVLVDCGNGDRMFFGAAKVAADSMVAKGYMELSRQFFPEGRYLVTDTGWRLLDWH